MNSRRSILLAATALALIALGAGAQSFDYDHAGRVTQARYDAGANITYRYMLDGSLTNITLAGTQTEEDGDSDTMPDAWEWVWFNSLTNTSVGDFNRDTKSNLQHYQDRTDPTGSDSDDDGMPNADETFADMNPLDSNSCFRLIALDHANSFTVWFVCTNSRMYSLEFSDRLGTGHWSRVTGPSNGAADGAMSLIDTNDAAQRAYRVDVSLP